MYRSDLDIIFSRVSLKQMHKLIICEVFYSITISLIPAARQVSLPTHQTWRSVRTPINACKIGIGWKFFFLVNINISWFLSERSANQYCRVAPRSYKIISDLVYSHHSVPLWIWCYKSHFQHEHFFPHVFQSVDWSGLDITCSYFNYFILMNCSCYYKERSCNYGRKIPLKNFFVEIRANYWQQLAALREITCTPR